MRMKFSLVNGVKREPAPKLKGICCYCGAATQSKCGNRKVWHWAHVSLQSCDSWWENETEWHRQWKSYFPTTNQEIIHFDKVTGEKHIADIKTNNSMVIEIQNSPIDELEVRARESFYGKMMWIVNGEKFRKNFIILGKLPSPKSSISQQVIFRQPVLNSYKQGYAGNQPADKYNELAPDGVDFLVRAKNPELEEALKPNYDGSPFSVMLSNGTEEEEIVREINSNYVGHHLFTWKRKRAVWFEAQKPVFLDFGGSSLWLLKRYSSLTKLMCVRRIERAALIKKNGGQYVH